MVRGVVTSINSRKEYALLQILGHRQTVLAAFSEIKNATPAVLEIGESVNFTLIVRGRELLARDIFIQGGA